MDRPDPEPMVPCFTLADVSLVPHAKAMLESAGIPFFVKNEGTQHLFGYGAAGGTGYNLIVGAPVVMVPASSVDAARAALSALETHEQPEPPQGEIPSSCSRCHRPIDAGEEELTHCYHCGWPLTPE